MTKNPYSFPARSREAMIAAMESIGGYSGWHAPSRRAYPFAWNVKLDYQATDAKSLGDAAEGEPFNAKWDSAFDKETEGEGFMDSLVESMRWQVESYSTYPGDDSGEFEFTFAGRSGGWLILESAYGYDMAGLDLADLADSDSYTFAGLDFADLADSDSHTFAEVRKLYKAVMTMDSDFARDKVRAEARYQIAFMRSQWEEERRERLARTVAEVTSNQATAKALLGELRDLKRLPALAPYVRACAALRGAIRNAIGDARNGRHAALALALGEESGS